MLVVPTPPAGVRVALSKAMAPACGDHFGWLAEALARAGLGYDIVDERMLDTLLGADPRFATLVLPAVTTLASADTAEIIAAFVRNGGRLLATGPFPHKTRMKGEEPSCAALFTSLAACGRVAHVPDATQQDIARLVSVEPRPLPTGRSRDLDNGERPAGARTARHRGMSYWSPSRCHTQRAGGGTTPRHLCRFRPSIDSGG